MKMSKLFYLAAFVSGSVMASDIQIVGDIKQTIPLTQNQGRSALTAPKSLQIALMKLQFSERAKQTFINRLNSKPPASSNTQNEPSRVQLGMNNVPVLNQGFHGSCVTFANTAAVDAAMNKGDYISQLCQLQLGQHFEKNEYAYIPSGWDGSFGPIVLNQMDMFGVVTMDKQKAYGCGGLKDYPTYDFKPDTDISLQEYKEIREQLPEGFSWSSVLDVNQFVLQEANTDEVLEAVKQALREGDRSTFGVLLDINVGTVGAAGTHHKKHDAWVLTKEIEDDLENNPQFSFGGHEMIITGYDDDAIAMTKDGSVHQGLLTLRNSWSEVAGDHGDFYMSYDYFRTLVMEVQRIRYREKKEG